MPKTKKSKSNRIKDTFIGFWVTREDYEKWILPIVLEQNRNVSEIFRDNLMYIYYLEKYPIYKAILNELIKGNIHSLRDIIVNAVKTAIEQIQLPQGTTNHITVNVNIQNLIERVETLIEKVDYLLQAQSIEKVVVMKIPQYIVAKILDVTDLAKMIIKTIITEKSRNISQSYKSIIAFKVGAIEKVLKEINKIIKDLESKYRLDIYEIAKRTNSKELQDLAKIKDILTTLKRFGTGEIDLPDDEVKKLLNEALLN